MFEILEFVDILEILGLEEVMEIGNKGSCQTYEYWIKNNKVYVIIAYKGKLYFTWLNILIYIQFQQKGK